MKVIKVEWLDSRGIDGIWHFKEEWDLTSHRCVSVGILVADDRDEIIICQSKNDDQYGNLFVIPKNTIMSREDLEL